MSQPQNKHLYNQVKKEAKQKFKVWPSAYASGWLVKEYKRRGGTYTPSLSPEPSALSRWYKEEWIDVCELPRKVPCGRDKAKMKNYPYCRPSKKVTNNTPKLASELTKEQIRSRCLRKKANPKVRILSDMAWMSYNAAAKYIPEAERLNVSTVARSSDGFMGVYKRVKTSSNMKRQPYSDTQTWGRRRDNFVKRHMAQYVKNPTYRRWLALVMWAYKPPGKKPEKMK